MNNHRRILRTMIRLYMLMWYFTNSKRPQESSAPSWYRNEISRGHLWFYLALQKHFCEDWRSTLRRLYYFLGGPQPTGTTEHGLKWAEIQKIAIYDVVDKAVAMGYLQVARGKTNPMDMDTILTTDWKGREFKKPIVFIEACAREYGYFSSILTSFLFGAGGALLIVFWDAITTYLAAIV